MSRAAACLILLASSPAWAAAKPALPEAAQVLEAALAGPAVSFEATAYVKLGKARSKKAMVRCSPSSEHAASCRREFPGAKAGAGFITATDGAKEWAFDKALNRVWEGPASAPSRSLAQEAQARYRVSLSTGGKVAGRLTWRLELQPRSPAALGRRLWVDREHGLILKDEAVLPDGKVALRTRFSKVTFGVRHDPALFRPEPVAGAGRSGRLSPGPEETARIGSEAGFEPRFPSWLPSGFVFAGADLLPYKDKKIVHCRYSDGAVALSLFQSPPRAKLDLGAKERREVRLASGLGFVSWTEDAGVLGWSSGETRLVLVAPMGLETLSAVAESVR
ncbi:MAG: hypothetical protein HY924_04125 [Elusimicrobia bacterium]|nr:hypothetical protein [Elusimicrobiota bacterium]